MTRYQHAIVDGSKIFYREAGPKTAPTILLLHGFPTSSHMFRNLIPALADRYRVIAPDLPGFGFSDAPDRKRFRYTPRSSTRSPRRSVSNATGFTSSITARPWASAWL